MIRRYTVSCHLGVEFLKYLYTENIMNNINANHKLYYNNCCAKIICWYQKIHFRCYIIIIRSINSKQQLYCILKTMPENCINIARFWISRKYNYWIILLSSLCNINSLCVLLFIQSIEFSFGINRISDAFRSFVVMIKSRNDLHLAAKRHTIAHFRVLENSFIKWLYWTNARIYDYLLPFKHALRNEKVFLPNFF